jgi:protein O-mannosyl-transferase
MMQTILFRLKPHLVPLAVLLLATLAVFGKTVGFDFLSNWDDYQYVTSNPDIRGFTATNLLRVFTSVYVGNYAPVHLLSYMLDYQLAGLSPAWFHGVNVLFHVANGLLFYLLVQRLTGKPFWAFVSAAVFLLHPAQVESVAWVTERKNLLAMFFSLGSFLCYVAYRRRAGEEKHLAYFFSLLLLVLALLAKSIAVIVPFAFLLYDISVELPPRRKGLFADKIPFVAAVAVAAGITLYTQSVEMGGGNVDLFEGDLTARFLTMLAVFTTYLQILVWPALKSLNSIYIFRIKTGIDGEVVRAFLAVLALCAAGVWLWRRERPLFFGFALFFLGLVPVSQIVPLATLMNDRYLYFPMLGAAWLIGGLLSRLHDRFPQKWSNPALLLSVCLLLPLAVLSCQRAQVWQNAIALWSDVVMKLPSLRDPRAALAAAYLYDGQKAKALATYEEVFALKREFSEPLAERKALLEAATLYLDAGAREKALPLLLTLTTKFPDYPPGVLKLGYYHYLGRNLPEAEKTYRRVLQLDPRSSQALISLGNICLETGRVAEAREWYRKCYENGGNSADLQYNMACVEALAGKYETGLRHLEEALRLGYRNLDAINGNPELAPLRRLASFNRLIADHFGRP